MEDFGGGDGAGDFGEVVDGFADVLGDEVGWQLPRRELACVFGGVRRRFIRLLATKRSKNLAVCQTIAIFGRKCLSLVPPMTDGTLGRHPTPNLLTSFLLWN